MLPMTELEKQARRAKEALRKAVIAELQKKRCLGHYAVFYRHGKAVRVEPEQLPVTGKR